MAAGTTYDCIATTTSTGSTVGVQFANISQSYTDLVLVVSGKNSVSHPYYKVQFNSTAGTAYNFIRFIGFGTAPYTDRYVNYSEFQPSIGSTQGTLIFNIFNYSDTNKAKSVLWRQSSPTGADLTVGAWRNNNAVTQIDIQDPVGNNMVAGTIFSLYGIAAA